jgi:hypothetical protein
MNEAEKRFREAESQLDGLLGESAAAIAALGVTIEDRSVRRYGHWREYLSWHYRFETRRARGSEVQKVWVEVSLAEADAGAVRVWRGAEIFQVGQFSRWKSTAEEVLPLSEVARGGLSGIVIEGISAGEAAAAAVAA